MSTKEFVTDLDYERLFNIIENFSGNLRPVVELEEKLDSMNVIKANAVPGDLITMNSKVHCLFEEEESQKATDSQALSKIRLVYPHQANIEEGCVSIFTPLGVALLGARAGHRVEWVGRDGCKRSLQVQTLLYQPEAHGDWHL